MPNQQDLAHDLRSFQRQLNFFKLYAAISTLAIVGLAAAAFRPREKQRITQLEVERLTIVEPDGRPALVMANRTRVPGSVIDGQERERHGMQANSMLFYNDRGDENGGLYFDSKTDKDGKYQAAAGLLFDQHRGDQVIGMTYDEQNGEPEAGFRIWEHKWRLPEYIKAIDEAKAMPPGPAREAKINEVRSQWGEERMFLGRHPDGTIELVMADHEGRPRVRLGLDAGGRPKLEMLDASGHVVQRLAP